MCWIASRVLLLKIQFSGSLTTAADGGVSGRRKRMTTSILAMIASREGRKSEAIVGIHMARESVENALRGNMTMGSYSQGFWFDWFHAKLLLDEAVRSVGS